MTSSIRVLVSVLVCALFVVSAFAYQVSPATIPTHWNMYGVADGFSGKAFGLFLLPVIVLFLTILLGWVLTAAPQKEALSSVRGKISFFFVSFVAFFFALHLITVFVALGYAIAITAWFSILFGLFFVGIGYVIFDVPRNYVVGIRTPWTLASDAVWQRTHRVGGWLFGACGAIAILGSFSLYAFWFVLVPIITSGIFLLGYSYFLYKKQGVVR